MNKQSIFNDMYTGARGRGSAALLKKTAKHMDQLR